MVAAGPGQALGVGVVEGQRVDRQVIGRERDRRIERPDPVGEGRIRRVVQEVEADREDPGHGLSADRQAIHAGRVQGLRVAPFVGAGVCLEGDLRAGGDAVARPDGGQQGGDRIGRHERRRPAADVDRLEWRPVGAVRRIERVGPYTEFRVERVEEGPSVRGQLTRRRPRSRNRGRATGRMGCGCTARREDPGRRSASPSSVPLLLATDRARRTPAIR